MDVKRTLSGVVLLAIAGGTFACPTVAAAEQPLLPKVDANAKVARTGPVAAPKPSDEATEAALSRIVDRPHTVAELEVGIIALPTAPISAGQSGGDTPFGTIGRGDATLQTGIHVLYRWERRFAVGAGVLFAPLPTSDTEYGGLRSLPRTHSRSYFFLGGEGRYVPLHYRFLEAWVGLSVGGVVIADRFITDAGDRVAPILGSKEVTVRTEGFAFGVQVGASYFLSENWIMGATFRGYRWLLPETPRCSSIGDCATLSGTVEALELGLTVGYRLPL
jgi:opacity protein-like surface antigen